LGGPDPNFENAQLDAQLALASRITSSSDAVSPERRVVPAVEHTRYNSSRKRGQSRWPRGRVDLGKDPRKVQAKDVSYLSE